MKLNYTKDGDQWCCTDENFEDLQASIAGFGCSTSDARADYRRQKEKIPECTGSTCDLTRFLNK